MQTSPDLGTVFPLSSQASRGSCWQHTWKWGNCILCPHCSDLLGLGHRRRMCFLCSWATFVLLQPGSLIYWWNETRQGASHPFLGKMLLSHLCCDFPEKYPFQMRRSCCYWSLRQKYFQSCLNMLFRSVARKMAAWIRKEVGRGGKSLDGTLTFPANAGFFSASTEAQLEIIFVVFCAPCTLL